MIGTTVEVQLTGKFPEGPLSFWSNLPGVDWQTRIVEGQKDLYLAATAAIAADAVPGVRFLRLYNDHGASKLHRFVIGTIPEINEQEPNDLLSSLAVQLADPVLINGVLQKRSDVDHFRVLVPAGRTLVATIDAQRGLSSPLDACLQLVNNRGTVLSQNLDYYGLDPQLVWASPDNAESADNEVIIRVFGFPASPDSSISLAGGDDYAYRLTLATGSYLQAAIPMALDASKPTPVQLLGYNLPEELRERTLNAPNGQANLIFADPALIGSLSFPISQIPLLTESSKRSAPAAPVVVTLPVCLNGRIAEASERDTYRFTTTKELKWRIRVESRSLGYPLDPLIVIEDIIHKEIKRADDSGNAVDPDFVWQAPADGEYVLTLSDLNRDGGEFYIYRVWIEPETPDVDLRIAEAQYTGKVAEPLEIAVTINRRGGFKQPVICQGEGLPDVVTCDAITSATEGDTEKLVKLIFKSTAPWSGPVRIGGKFDAPSTKPRIATTNLEQLEQFWLTFLP